YLEKLKSIIQYTGVSDVRMEEGSLRADANISIRPVGEETFGTKTELKNLNSFAFVRDGIAEEAKRQAKVLDANEEVVQSSRRYDEKTKKSVLMRVKVMQMIIAFSQTRIFHHFISMKIGKS